MRVAVTGTHGLIGSALVSRLRDGGHEVVRVVRSTPNGPDEVRWDPDAGTIDGRGLAGVDGVVHLAGEGIGEKRWTDEQKRRIVDSRVKGTRLLAARPRQCGRRDAHHHVCRNPHRRPQAWRQ